MKELVATIKYEEYLPSGEILIGSTVYSQDWNAILPALGFSREEFTFNYECNGYLDEHEDCVETNNTLYVYKK